ncbi:hypothetical protein T06_16456 [Trichinella sp. T6]|nr:hypothetical protein T06_16456 [Trichinella sp. T6]
MDQVIKSAQEASGALEKELLQKFPSGEAVDKYRGEKSKKLRHGTRSSVEWEQCADLIREQVGAADEWLRQKCSFDGFSRATWHYESLMEAKAEKKEAPENIATVAAWENDEKEGQRRLDQITAAMESTDFIVALQRNRLILKIQRAEKTGEALRRWCDDSQLSRESLIRLEELSIDLEAAIITAERDLRPKNIADQRLLSEPKKFGWRNWRLLRKTIIRLRNFVIAVKSIIATMKAHGYDVEKNPQFTRQLERKLNWVLVTRWCQKRNGNTPNHLLDFLEKEAEILQRAHLLKPDVITGQRTPQVVKAKERTLIGVGNVEKSSVQRPVGALSAAGKLLKIFLRGPRKTILTTAVIDSGCSRTPVDEDLAKDLGLKRIPGGEVKWADWAKDQPKFAKLPMENVSYADVRILLGQGVKELTENVYTTKLPSDKEAVMYCCIINDEVDHGTALLQEFQNFNSLEGLGITDKAIGLSRYETEDLEHMQNGTVVFSNGRGTSKTASDFCAEETAVKSQAWCGRIAVNADVKEMFSQIAVLPADSDMLAFLSTSSVDREPDVHVNQRHVFGATCSPAAVNFALREAVKRKDAAIAQIVNEAFYMDDLYWSDENEDVVIQRSQELKTAFREACFELSKWVSNSRKVIETWPMEERTSVVKELAGMGNSQLTLVKGLGVAWDCEQDSLTFACRRQGEKAKTCQSSHQFLIPLASSETRWQQWVSDVKVVASVSIPRWYGIDRGKPSTMHVFVDAATVGYGSVAYLAQGMTTAFVAAKSRVVNPLKTTTVSRLELQAFIVGVRLADTLLKELENRLVIGRVVFWSDRLVVLYWINSDENRYLPIVSNRLRDINETLQSIRLDATGLIKRFDFWTAGPKFLKREEEWPETKVKPPDNDLELRPKAIAFFVGSNSADADKCSSVAEFLKQRLGKDTLNCEDFDREEKKIIKEAQMEDFRAEISACNKASGISHPKKRCLATKAKSYCHATKTSCDSTCHPVNTTTLGTLVSIAPKQSLDVGSSFQDAFQQWSTKFTSARFAGRTVRLLCRCQLHRYMSTVCSIEDFHLSCVEWTFLVYLSSPGSRKDVESFLLALERFIQRRGKPQSIRSDQGTSFVKAVNEQDKSVEALAEELEYQVQDKWRIDFKFNPPGAPHWGGSWERMVQEIKKILMSTVESVAGLHKEAFRTLIVCVEGILNRRPITIDENGHTVCPMDIVSPGNKETPGFPTEASTLEVLRQVHQAAQRFWKRWYQFYLASLIADRNHGGKGRIDIRSGDMVLLKEGSNPFVSNAEDNKRQGSGMRHPSYFNHGGTSSGAHEDASCPTGIRGSVAARTSKIR